MWNGDHFVEQAIEFLQPAYRFQAIQDADSAVLIEKYQRANQLYQETITNSNPNGGPPSVKVRGKIK
ncbi:MAG: hypothetical protein U0V48_15535 [Anaerolineales bacterium]